MSPVHEKEWTSDEQPYGAGTRVVLKEGAAIIAIFPANEPTSAIRRRPRAKLAAAAPDMARALLEVYYGRGSPEYRERMARDALRKAGVLL